MFNFTKIEKNVGRFYENNRTVINSTIVYGALLFISKKFGLKLPGINYLSPRFEEPRREDDTTNDYTKLTGPCNSHEQAIVAFWRTGVGSYSNSTKEDSAKSIYNLLIDAGGVEDSTLAYAISAMSKIAQSSYSNYTKECINRLIAKSMQNVIVIAEEKKKEEEAE